MYELKQAIRSVLTDEKATPAEKLRAIEAAAKLLLIQHKITGESDGTDGHFFS